MHPHIIQKGEKPYSHLFFLGGVTFSQWPESSNKWPTSARYRPSSQTSSWSPSGPSPYFPQTVCVHKRPRRSECLYLVLWTRTSVLSLSSTVRSVRDWNKLWCRMMSGWNGRGQASKADTRLAFVEFRKPAASLWTRATQGGSLFARPVTTQCHIHTASCHTRHLYT